MTGLPLDLVPILECSMAAGRHLPNGDVARKWPHRSTRVQQATVHSSHDGRTNKAGNPCVHLWVPLIWHLIRGPWRSSLQSRSTTLIPRLVGGGLAHNCRVRAGIGQGQGTHPIHPVGPLISLYCRSRHSGVPGVDLMR